MVTWMSRFAILAQWASRQVQACIATELSAGQAQGRSEGITQELLAFWKSAKLSDVQVTMHNCITRHYASFEGSELATPTRQPNKSPNHLHAIGQVVP